MKDIMLDLETLGTSPGSLILSIGAIAFDRDGAGLRRHLPVEDLGASFYITIDIDCVLRGRLPADACRDFNAFVESVADEANADVSQIMVWGNGAIFDNNLLRGLFTKAAVQPAWKWYNDLCFRTLKHVVAVEAPEHVGTSHNALDDAKTQALHAVRIFHELGTRG